MVYDDRIVALSLMSRFLSFCCRCSSCVLLSLVDIATAQTPVRVTDGVRTYYRTSQPSDFFNASPSRVIFTAVPPGRFSAVPFVTDGTAAGTAELIQPPLLEGTTLSGPFQSVGGFTLFITTGNDVTTLWKTDGTSAGTTSLTVEPVNMVSAGTYLIGVSETSGGASRLWRMDGSPAGTSAFYTAPANTNFTPGAMAAGHYFFGGNAFTDDGRQDSLWKSNGTLGGTSLIRPLSYTEGGETRYDQYPSFFTEWQGVVYFMATEFAEDPNTFVTYERSVLWRTDGTAGGTVRLGAPGPLFRGSYTSAGSLYFITAGNLNLGGGVQSPTIWKSNGTVAGTVMVFSGSLGNTPMTNLNLLGAYGGSMWFNLTAENFLQPTSLRVSRLARQLSTGELEAVADLPSVARVFGGPGLSYASPLAQQQGAFYLRISGGVDDVWRITQGNPPSIQSLGAGAVASDALLGGSMIGRGDNGLTGAEVYSSANGGTLIAEINPGIASTDRTYAGYSGHAVQSLNGILLFPGQDQVRGMELWRSDGTPGGTFPLMNASPREKSSSIEAIVTHGTATAWLRVKRGDLSGAYEGYEVWRTDGTTANTLAVHTFTAGEYPSEFFVNGPQLIGYVQNGPNPGGALRVLDGPHTLATLYSGDRLLKTLTSAGNVWFTTSDPVAGATLLHRSDGTGAPAVRVFLPTDYQLSSLECSFAQGVLCVASSRSAPEIISPDLRDLFYITAQGATRLTSAAYAAYASFTSSGSRLYFSRYHEGAYRLYVTDGTAGGTLSLGSFDQLDQSPDLGQTGRGQFFFYAKQLAAEQNYHLWKTDGTLAGTVKTSLPPSSNPRLMSTGPWLIYEVSNDSTNPQIVSEFYFTDGTGAGTRLPFLDGTSFFSFYAGTAETRTRPASATSVFFGKYDTTEGSEIYHFSLPAGPVRPFDLWTAAAGLTGSNALAEADPDKDGIPNLLEYLSGTLPHSAASAAPPTVAPQVFSASTQATLTFRRMESADLIVTVESSLDCVEWQPDNVLTPDGTLTPQPGRRSALFSRSGTNPEMLSIVTLPAGGHSKMFLRIRARLP